MSAVTKVVEKTLKCETFEFGKSDWKYLGELEACKLAILQERVKVQREYFEGREKLRIPKGKEYTDFDRNTMLEASVAELREKYEYVKGLEELVRERVELYKLMMSNG